MYCKECGKEISADAKCCPYCGAVLENSSGAVSPKSALVALLFGIFLGGIGINNFYLGHIGRGITKIVLRILGTAFYILGVVHITFGSIGGISDFVEHNIFSISEASVLGSIGLICLGGVLLFIGSTWAFIEWILIACGKAKDSNGLPVTNWNFA